MKEPETDQPSTWIQAGRFRFRRESIVAVGLHEASKQERIWGIEVHILGLQSGLLLSVDSLETAHAIINQLTA